MRREPLPKATENQQMALDKGWLYLEENHRNGYFTSYISASRDMHQEPKESPAEPFSTIVIADILLNYQPKHPLTKIVIAYIKGQEHPDLFTFFEDRDAYPPDTDVNALGYSILSESGLVDAEEANRALDRIISFQNADKIIQVWLSHERKNYLDPVVAANALYFASLLGRASELSATQDWLLKVCESEAYLNGSRYYQSPDAFLYFMGRLCIFEHLKKQLSSILVEQLNKRIGSSSFTMDLAMRSALANTLGIQNNDEKAQLLKLQNTDGSWPADALFHYGSHRHYFGSKALTTAICLDALRQ